MTKPSDERVEELAESRRKFIRDMSYRAPETWNLVERGQVLTIAMVALDACDEQRARAERAEADAARLREALEDVQRWSEAYPDDVFIEPDWKRVRQLLEDGGIALDAVSAGAIRPVVQGIGERAHAALTAAADEGEQHEAP